MNIFDGKAIWILAGLLIFIILYIVIFLIRNHVEKKETNQSDENSEKKSGSISIVKGKK